MSIPSFALVLCAAGTSQRFNLGQSEHFKKEFLSLDGHSVLYRSMAPFFAFESALKAVCVTIPEGLEEKTLYALEDLGLQTQVPILLCPGGATRQDSVLKALEELDKSGLGFDYVMIHDGSRPYLEPNLVAQTLAMATVAGAAAPVVPIVDAIKTIDDQGFISTHPERKGLYGIQTPQAFRFPEILKAHRMAKETAEVYLDDTQIYHQFIGKVATVIGSSVNRKITFAGDLG